MLDREAARIHLDITYREEMSEEEEKKTQQIYNNQRVKIRHLDNFYDAGMINEYKLRVK